MIKIFTCSCKHEYQDNRYGKQQRVYNETTKLLSGGQGTQGSKVLIGYRCTVCGVEKLV